MDMLWNFEGMVSIIQPERNYGSSELLEQLFIANYHFFLATTEKCSHSCQTLWRHIIKSNQLYKNSINKIWYRIKHFQNLWFEWVTLFGIVAYGIIHTLTLLGLFQNQPITPTATGVT